MVFPGQMLMGYLLSNFACLFTNTLHLMATFDKLAASENFPELGERGILSEAVVIGSA